MKQATENVFTKYDFDFHQIYLHPDLIEMCFNYFCPYISVQGFNYAS